MDENETLSSKDQSSAAELIHVFGQPVVSCHLLLLSIVILTNASLLLFPILLSFRSFLLFSVTPCLSYPCFKNENCPLSSKHSLGHCNVLLFLLLLLFLLFNVLFAIDILLSFLTLIFSLYFSCSPSSS